MSQKPHGKVDNFIACDATRSMVVHLRLYKPTLHNPSFTLP